MTGEEGERERSAVNYAFIQSELITSLTALETAIHCALLAEENGALRTKYIHSEILWALNPTTNISDAFRRFGVADTTTSMIVISASKLPTTDASYVQSAMQSVVQGDIVPLQQLSTDWSAVKKCYKLGAEPSLRGLSIEEEQLQIDRMVINNIGLKPVAI
ncbi:hypothetical protein M408DRAFT_332588 [Serendipita vermifera MAFF 305830]|uniref:EKC/KEOPS complex subunit CGI121 n=1 Tax=Serendipita vermifera MAFF 305830 TaxID=933852 RepID=A0A0C3ASL0_SERVB|nr:hypothetical protein M408DRAFT_332588 [Serendipita vermifera MAFF 305830]